MAPKPTPSTSPPAGVPSGNGKYIAVAVLLLAVVGGAIAWKMSQKPEVITTVIDAGAPIPSATAVHTGRDQTEDIPLPEVIPDAGEPKKTSTVATGGGGGAAGCDGKCNGKTTSELETALAFRTRQAHRCYDNALGQDPTLRGKITVSVKVGSNGQTCPSGVSIASNEMGSSTVANCVLGYYRGQSFPAPQGGCAEVNIPINFVPRQ